ncbi:MAG: PKD domain-containing protein, partial [Candidatus Cloacimonetes bacterium]|nr:PKD domain-containing protein [Candidatus Cloacimonadota bacterium]
MKKTNILLGLLLSLIIVNTGYAITVDGNAYLENQTDHSGIKVLFERTAPSSLTDSTYTDLIGYYSIDIETGFYDITYSKDGYNSEFLYDQSLFADTTLPDVTLLEHQTLLNVPSDFSTIQSAIDYAYDSDTVLVQPGTYVENINFNGKNITVASLYLTTQDTSYISQTIIDGNQGGSVVRFENGEDSTAVLAGFTIQNGYSDSGGGICCYSNSSPSLKNVTITDNFAYSCGGGICCSYSSPNLENVTLIGNTTSPGQFSTSGGGIYCSYSSSILQNVMIKNNSVIGGGSYDCGYGGGITLSHSSLILDNVIITNNSVTGYRSYGGGIYCAHSSPSLQNVTISGNSADNEGGGIFCYVSSPTLENVTINDNSVSYYFKAGGIYCSSYSSNPYLENVTITNNSGSGIVCSGSSLTLVNCIVSYNNGSGISSGSPSISYSDFYNNEYGNFNNCGQWLGVNVITNANGDSCDIYYNIQMDPCFVDTTNGDYHLQSNSPCIDAGDPSSPLDPDGTIADMGAFYFDHNCPIADFTSDVTIGNIPLIVNFTDLSQESSFGIPIISWLWDFGDSITSTEQNPSHEFLSGGYYTISLTVTDSAGYSDTEIKQDYIHAISVEIQNLDIGGDEDLQHLLNHTPLITFEFYNAGGLTQTHYQIQVSTDSLFSVIDMWDTGVVASSVSSVVYAGNPLVDGITYYLRARVASGDAWSDWATLQFRMNSLPSIPVLLSPINNEIVFEINPILWIMNSTDAELDTLTYDFELATDVTFNNILFSQSNVTEGIDTTSCQVTITLTDNQQYWWRAKTYDGYEYCNYANPESFVLNSENEPPGEFELLTPENGTEVTTL